MLKLKIPCLNTNEGKRKYQHDLSLDLDLGLESRYKTIKPDRGRTKLSMESTDKLKGVQTIIVRQVRRASVYVKTSTPQTMIKVLK